MLRLAESFTVPAEKRKLHLELVKLKRLSLPYLLPEFLDAELFFPNCRVCVSPRSVCLKRLTPVWPLGGDDWRSMQRSKLAVTRLI